MARLTHKQWIMRLRVAECKAGRELQRIYNHMSAAYERERRIRKQAKKHWGSPSHTAAQIRYAQTYPEKIKAQAAAKYAVKVGILTRPKNCSQCGRDRER